MIKILVVDEDAAVCEAFKKTFVYIGFSVLTARTAEKALMILEKEHPKIVFVNGNLSDSDGVSLIGAMKRKDPAMMAIIMADQSDHWTRERVVALGADDLVIKPFSQNYLRDVVVQKIGNILEQSGHVKIPVILLVDDEADFRATIRDFIISRYECSVVEADDGAGAIDLVETMRPDVILVDIKMPGLSGIDVIEQMKKMSPESRIIVLSAWKSAEVVAQAVSKGAADYLSKPVSLAAFNEKLKHALIALGKCKTKGIERRGQGV